MRAELIHSNGLFRCRVSFMNTYTWCSDLFDDNMRFICTQTHTYTIQRWFISCLVTDKCWQFVYMCLHILEANSFVCVWEHTKAAMATVQETQGGTLGQWQAKDLSIHVDMWQLINISGKCTEQGKLVESPQTFNIFLFLHFACAAQAVHHFSS